MEMSVGFKDGKIHLALRIGKSTGKSTRFEDWKIHGKIHSSLRIGKWRCQLALRMGKST